MPENRLLKMGQRAMTVKMPLIRVCLLVCGSGKSRPVWIFLWKRKWKYLPSPFIEIVLNCLLVRLEYKAIFFFRNNIRGLWTFFCIVSFCVVVMWREKKTVIQRYFQLWCTESQCRSQIWQMMNGDSTRFLWKCNLLMEGHVLVETLKEKCCQFPVAMKKYRFNLLKGLNLSFEIIFGVKMNNFFLFFH